MTLKYFASDNYAGIHAEVLSAIQAANQGHMPAYGDDEYTTQAIATFREAFGQDTYVYFVFNGTAANVTSIAAINHSYEAVICAETAHIQMDECGAPEKFTGSKLFLVPTTNGKLTVDAIKHHLGRVGDQHQVQPKTISIAQSTEYGTVYSIKEIRDIADFAHENGMYLHMDGARLANAAVSLGVSFRQMTRDAGVDVLSFGGTKNGLMMGEAVVFFDAELAKNYRYIRKQSMQLASKMRFIAAQFIAYFSNDLWKRNATHANEMAAKLKMKLAQVEGVNITQSVDANAIFASMPAELISRLQERFFFYVWNKAKSEVRIMTSFDTTEGDIEEFTALAEER